IWAGANVVGLGTGPFLAGAVSDATAWRWMFPPLTVLAAATAVFGATRSREVPGAAAAASDRAGQVLGTLGSVALVFAVIRGESSGWTSPLTTAGLAGGIALLALFLFAERRAANPVFPPSLFAVRGFTASAIAAAVALFTVIGIVFVFSIYLSARGVSDLGIAERLGCLFAGNAIASVVSGPLQTRLGSRPVLLGGLAVAAGGLAALLGASSPQLGELAWRLLITGAGCGSVVASSTAVAVQSVAGPLAAKAGTANNVVRQLGGALGTAVIGGVFAASLSGGHSTLDAVHAGIVALLTVLIAAGAITTALLARRRP
ncbi:MAG: hypothetical protein ACREFY_06855, partial [Acetobacteraceae bacterium]